MIWSDHCKKKLPRTFMCETSDMCETSEYYSRYLHAQWWSQWWPQSWWGPRKTSEDPRTGTGFCGTCYAFAACCAGQYASAHSPAVCEGFRPTVCQTICDRCAICDCIKKIVRKIVKILQIQVCSPALAALAPSSYSLHILQEPGYPQSPSLRCLM